MKFSELIKVEFVVLGAIIGVAVLNIVTLANLNSLSHRSLIENIIRGGIQGIGVYGLATILSLISIYFNKKGLIKIIIYLILTYMTLRTILNLILLIVNPIISTNGKDILSDAFLIWINSVLVFALWYWVVDHGGPIARFNESAKHRSDLLFAQHQTKITGWDSWKPKFIDYLYFSFFTSSSFAPADVLPLSHRIKFLMMIETCISLIIIGMVASRAITLIQ